MQAVLVGVGQYARPDIPPLRGPVNDVVTVRLLLKNVFGLENDDIRVLVDNRATRDAIMHRLRVLAAGAQPGDILVFYFSGHGSQVRDRDADELTDQLDEIICPYDMDWDGTFILDDDLDEVFAQLAPGVVLETFLDCCFWGAGLRELTAASSPDLAEPGERFIPPPVDIAARFEGDEADLAWHRFTGCTCFRGRNVLWAATEEGQVAVEDWLEGRCAGVFTHFGCRFIEDNLERIVSGGYSRELLLADLRAYLGRAGYLQVPELAAPPELLAAAPLSLDSRPPTVLRRSSVRGRLQPAT
jgi:hypothetical protein